MRYLIELAAVLMFGIFCKRRRPVDSQLVGENIHLNQLCSVIERHQDTSLCHMRSKVMHTSYSSEFFSFLGLLLAGEDEASVGLPGAFRK